jgi:transcriptional regulator with GAF, ATPase, and Fis domain
LLLVKKDGKIVKVNVSATWVEWNLTKYLFLIARENDATLTGGYSPAESNDASWSEQKDFPTIIGQSEKIRDVCRLIGAVAKSDATVLVQGESGTGKEIIANAIHMHSLRSRGPFVKVNCAALTETLLESELFGHVKGAFTGAICDRRGRFKQADGGTILLDEIGSMTLSGQAKLLRVLQEHEFEPVGSSVTIPVNVRVVASTNIDLAKAASEGKFREDLYYRLNVFSIPLPTLRERKEDILLLAQHFLGQHSRALGMEIQTVAPQTHALLIEHDWPGNVRELENAIEHAVIVEKGPVILPSSLPMNLVKSRPAKDDPELSAEMGLREKLVLLERQILLDTLLQAHGVKKNTAAMLGIDARNLPYLLRKHRVGSEFGHMSEN